MSSENQENITKTIDRLALYIEFKGISLHKISVEIGVSNSYFNKMIKNRASIGSDILEKILRIYTDLNPNWLLTGYGLMTLNSNNVSSIGQEVCNHKGGLPPGPCQQCLLRDQIIETQKDTINSLKTIIADVDQNRQKRRVG